MADVILPSRRLAPDERMEIYSGMYFSRLVECLEEDYPVLKAILGEGRFRELARAYLERYPSRHYSLNFLGRKLPEFLDLHARMPRRRFLRDVARLECAMSEVFDEKEARSLTPKERAAIPRNRLESASLRFIPAFRLLALDHPANAVVIAHRQGRKLPMPAPRRSWVAVYRKKFQVWRMDLAESQHALLGALAHGRSLRGAIRSALRFWTGTPPSFKEALFGWFCEWADEGFFTAVDL